MTKQKKYVFRIISLALLFLSLVFYYSYAANGTISLEITGKGVRHGTPNNVNLGILSTSTIDQEFSGQFDDYFWVEDMEGYITGYYTTIQCDGVYGSAGNKIIGIYLKAGDTHPTLLQGLTGNVLVASGLYQYESILNPVTYIYKETDIANNGIINQYGDKPRLKIIIPAYAPPGTYSGTIVFSFYPY